MEINLRFQDAGADIHLDENESREFCKLLEHDDGAFLLDEKKFKEITDYYYRGSKIDGQRVRTRYLKEEKISQIISRILKSGGCCAIIGGASGAAIGAIGGPEGALIGGGSGLLAGFIIGCIKDCVSERKKYTAWKETHYEGELWERFQQIHKENPRFRNCEDPIFHTVLVNPVRTKCGHVFERESIEGWLKKNAICPLGCGPVRLSDLQYDIGTIARISKVYADIIKDGLVELDGIKCSKEMKKAFIKLHENLEDQIDNHVQNAMADLQKQFTQKHIDRKVYERLTRDVFDLKG